MSLKSLLVSTLAALGFSRFQSRRDSLPAEVHSSLAASPESKRSMEAAIAKRRFRIGRTRGQKGAFGNGHSRRKAHRRLYGEW